MKRTSPLWSVNLASRTFPFSVEITPPLGFLGDVRQHIRAEALSDLISH